MSKKDNKRYNDKDRKGAPKRGGKNRRDYGEAYEPGRRVSAAGARKVSAGKAAGRRPAGGGRQSAKNSLPADPGYNGFDERGNIGTDGLEVVAGRNPVMEVLQGGREVERVFIADGSEGSVSKIVALAKENGVIVDFVPKERIDSMAPGVKHQGVAAKVSEYKYAEMDDVFAKAEEAGEDPFIIILDEISDPHNLGAIIRTAECAGAHGVVIPKRRSASLTQTVALSAAGAIENMPVVQVTNLGRAIEELKERGVWACAADMDGETYYEADLTGPIAIVIGNEGRGVGRLVKEKCDFVLSIPMKGRIDSLNASNAAAILMYGIRRAREEV